MGATNLPFQAGDQANPNLNWTTSSGSSHRWDRNMEAGMAPLNLMTTNANNIYGLRTYEELPSSNVQSVHANQGGAVCSTCHKQHYQATMPWDPSGNYDWGTATGGTNKVVQDSSKTWSTNQLVDFYVRIDSGTSRGTVRQIKENTTNSLTIYNTGVSTDPNARKSAFPGSIASGNSYTVMGKINHFLRMENDTNQICVYCHYYRDTDVSSNSSSARYQAWDGNKRSHPVNIRFSSAQGEWSTPYVDDSNQYNTAPLEPLSVFTDNTTVARQTDTAGFFRYKSNGGWDTNSTNNIVLDADGKVRCMSCHGMHYTYSDSSIPNVPPQ